MMIDDIWLVSSIIAGLWKTYFWQWKALKLWKSLQTTWNVNASYVAQLCPVTWYSHGITYGLSLMQSHLCMSHMYNTSISISILLYCDLIFQSTVLTVYEYVSKFDSCSTCRTAIAICVWIVRANTFARVFWTKEWSVWRVLISDVKI